MRAHSMEAVMNETNRPAAPRVAILMATYNGGKYLDEQLRSLLRQSYTAWQLYAADDLSRDDTYAILQRYAAADSRLHVRQNARRAGACANFLTLLGEVDADYYFFCDQDDVWLPEKIEATLSALQAAEGVAGEEVPLIVHTDLRVVDAALQPLAASFWHYSRIAPCLLRRFHHLAGHNLCTGCAMAFNRAARDAAQPFSPEALMHDAWVTARTLARGGRVVALAQPTVLYRQHAANVLGARDTSRHYVIQRLARLSAVVRENRAYYHMLRAAGYPSLARYLYEKLRYALRYALLSRHSSAARV